MLTTTLALWLSALPTIAPDDDAGIDRANGYIHQTERVALGYIQNTLARAERYGKDKPPTPEELDLPLEKRILWFRGKLVWIEDDELQIEIRTLYRYPEMVELHEKKLQKEMGYQRFDPANRDHKLWLKDRMRSWRHRIYLSDPHQIVPEDEGKYVDFCCKVESVDWNMESTVPIFRIKAIAFNPNTLANSTPPPADSDEDSDTEVFTDSVDEPITAATKDE